MELGFSIKKIGNATRYLLRTAIPINSFYIYPDPPINNIFIGADGKKTDYHAEIIKLASSKGVKSVFDYTKKLANNRNTYLYASPSSISKVSDIKGILSEHTRAVFYNFIAYLLIEPYPKQTLAQEALNAYLKILKRISL